MGLDSTKSLITAVTLLLLTAGVTFIVQLTSTEDHESDHPSEQGAARALEYFIKYLDPITGVRLKNYFQLKTLVPHKAIRISKFYFLLIVSRRECVFGGTAEYTNIQEVCDDSPPRQP